MKRHGLSMVTIMAGALILRCSNLGEALAAAALDTAGRPPPARIHALRHMANRGQARRIAMEMR